MNSDSSAEKSPKEVILVTVDAVTEAVEEEFVEDEAVEEEVAEDEAVVGGLPDSVEPAGGRGGGGAAGVIDESDDAQSCSILCEAIN